jgi:hypothetical protein
MPSNRRDFATMAPDSGRICQANAHYDRAGNKRKEGDGRAHPPPSFSSYAEMNVMDGLQSV